VVIVAVVRLAAACAQGESYLFMETAINFHLHRHTYLECVPMEKDAALDAPLYFNKVRLTPGRVLVMAHGALLVPSAAAVLAPSMPCGGDVALFAGADRGGGLDHQQEFD
jgi:hypothetical protein